MIPEQNESSSEAARLRAETQRINEPNWDEGPKAITLIPKDACRAEVTLRYQTQPCFAEPAQPSIWKRLSSTWLAKYRIISYDTDPATWVLGCTHSKAGQFVPIVVFDRLEDAQNLLDRLVKTGTRPVAAMSTDRKEGMKVVSLPAFHRTSFLLNNEAKVVRRSITVA